MSKVTAPDFRSLDQYTGQVVCETCGCLTSSYAHYTECEETEGES